MGTVSSFLQPLKENIKFRLRWRYLWKDWFLGRHACLGYDVLKYYDKLPREVNFQKGRADLLLRYWADKSLLPISSRLSPLMARNDVLPHIRQLEFFNCLPMHPPRFILMDSFAELTDQLFTQRSEGWQFCCAYSDLVQEKSFSEEYESNGLLPIENMRQVYLELFSFFINRWGAVPIYFLHFPIALETRENLRKRHAAMIEIIHQIALEYPNVHSIAIDESSVQWPNNTPEELKAFPYHYDEETYLAFKKNIEQVAPLQR
ncbi:SGNH/GDSL hydrolase family protein [Polynucleobacter arcticus]|uniref:Uncharacterized protein n=1 Tax=Polynucleobacter arcticus TaxID=1743165 RepID=A0A6M9PHG1_9BURK|nr:SGNH/GDSL hydrolase family protein [Polynucleobacter arcticus]QKM59839.1 hypothetical protein DN92_01600 [Polynucleobacter arcticus]